jgi:hypothetical protein
MAFASRSKDKELREQRVIVQRGKGREKRAQDLKKLRLQAVLQRHKDHPQKKQKNQDIYPIEMSG